MKTVIRLVSTCFYAGYVPRVSGTAGSVFGLLLFLLVSYSFPVTVITLSALTVAALLVIKGAEELFGKKDSRRIVIDEAIGMMITLLFIPMKPEFITLAFIFFRVFDIIKPFPIKRIEKIKSPWGVVLDDVVAAVYANLSVQIIAIFALKSGV
ncbi:MAG: phosphatidylglycerophosphatase A [Candidatus Omnitrophica bacterium]|nr:phosphatidylglycerophosphatase A [Candidatus Omnitrophota bacterium]